MMKVSSAVPVITVVWACLMTFAALISILKRTTWLPFPAWVYFDLTLFNIVVGLAFTTIFKRKNGCNANLPMRIPW